MKNIFSFAFTCMIFCNVAIAQKSLQQKEDSILKIAQKTTNTEIICDAYLSIAKLYLGQNMAKETEYLNKTFFVVEQSRDRKLIANYCIKIADTWNGYPTPDRHLLALSVVDKGLQIAKEAQLNKEVAILMVRKAISYRLQSNISEAVKYNEEAVAYAALSKSDSVQILTEISYANTLILKDENLSAFKKYMHALNQSEEIKNEDFQNNLNQRIGDFYSKVGQNEKAKDYYMKGLKLSVKLADTATEVTIYNSLIRMYTAEKDFATAREYLGILKQKGTKSNFFKQYAISNESNIIGEEDIKKIPEFFSKNKEIFAEFEKYGTLGLLYRLKAMIFTVEKKNDSALFYFGKSKKLVNQNSLNEVLEWNSSYAFFLDQNKKYLDAAKLYDENVLIAKKMQSLTYEKNCYEYLDSLYIKAGDKNKEVSNKLLLFSLKDSLNKQQKENDLLGVEIDIENKRNEREAAEQQLKKERRNNLQYMGISGAIILLFILLAALGKFKVRPGFIKALGFLSFILLFEFIILLIDHQIHDLTHGEPLPLLLIKIVIIAFLLPFHHWLEHKVINYLVKNNSAVLQHK